MIVTCIGAAGLLAMISFLRYEIGHQYFTDMIERISAASLEDVKARRQWEWRWDEYAKAELWFFDKWWAVWRINPASAFAKDPAREVR